MKIKLLCFLTVTFGLGIFSLRAAIPPAENLLPADTLAFFTVPDSAALRTTAKQSPQFMFWNDTSMKPFHDRFMAKFNEKFVTPLEKDLGVQVADFADLPQGQFTLAFTVNGSNGHDDTPPGFLLLLDARDKSDSLKTNLAALKQKCLDAGRAVRTETFHGLAFTVIPLSSNDFADIFPRRAAADSAKAAKPAEIYFAQSGSLLIAGNSPKVVEPVAAHLTGGGTPAIADDATFAADKIAQFRDSPNYYGWFNTKGFFNLISSTPENSDADPESVMPKLSMAKTIGALGLGGLKSAAFAMRESRDGSSLTFNLNAPESTRAGLLKILELPAKDASPPAFVPADAVKFSRFRIDGQSTWAELQKIASALSPQAVGSLNAIIDTANAMAQQKGDTTFDLRKNLIGNLGDDFISYQKSPVDSSTEALASPPAIFLMATVNPDQVIQAIKTVSAMAAPQDDKAAPRDFRGHKIYPIAMRATRNPTTGALTPNTLYCTSGSGYVGFSSQTSILEEFLRSADNPGKPLRDTPGLADAMQRVGGAGNGLFGYENQRETLKTAFALLRNSASNKSTLLMLPPALREWADFSLLPAYDQISKYFYFTVYSGDANSSGLTLKAFTPRPPQLP
jgi:hypothetical protein